MHTWFHNETLVNINYNSDYSGDAIVSVIGSLEPELIYTVTDPKGEWDEGIFFPYGTKRFSVRIPAKALADFGKDATLQRVRSALEQFVENLEVD